jgi:peptide/nickel transport system substrate-binding protein
MIEEFMKTDNKSVKNIINVDTGIQQLLKDDRVSRRDFLSFATALGLTAAMGSSLWSNRAMAAGPVRGGHLIAGLNDANTIDNLDSTQWVATTMIVIGRSIRDSIVDVGVDGKPTPNLAESWEASSDAKTWRFKIRQGVVFSNGKSLTIEDVIASVNVHRGEDSKSAAKGVFSGISDVKADGNTMVITLTDGNADLPFLFTDYHFSVVPSENGVADLLSTHGTGCYLLKEYNPGVRTVLEKNPNAWQGNELGHFDSAEIIAINDDTARQSALTSGTVEVINRPSLKTIHLLKRVKSVNIVDVASNLAFTNPMRTKGAPYDNNDFRTALKLSLPRQAFVDKVLFGYGSVGNDQPIGPQMGSYDSELSVPYDLDKAKYHLKKAGMDGAKFEMSSSDTAYGGAMDASQLFAESWKKIGLKPSIVREPQDGYWANVWNKKPFCSCYWGPRPVEDMILSIAYLSDSPWNDTQINIPRVDELVIKARGELDQVKRKGMYKEVQHLISKDGGTLVPAFGSDVAATSNTIGIGPQIGGGWEMDGGHFVKRWWKKA